MSENGKYYDACRCRWLSKNNGVCKNQRNVSICETDSYEMRFSLLVQRSYGDIIWELYTTNCTPLTLRKTKLQVTYSAKVTGLEVDGQEVNETYLVEDNQKVNISCSFTNGNPPVSVRLMDDIGSALNSSKHKEGPLTLIIGMFRCSEVWPTVRCEAAGSKLNRSVTILGRCLPQLSHIGSQLVALPKVLKEGLKLRLRSYTSDIRNCLVTKLPPQPTTKKVTCELSGRIPNFSLTMRFAGEMLIDEGIWILHAITELGFSNITFVLINNTGGGSRGGNAQNETTNGNEGERTSKKSDSSTSSPGQAAGNGSKSGGSTPRSSSSGSDKPSTNPNYTSTALQEVEIHPYMDLHTRDPTYASTTSSKDPHMYMELKPLKALQPGSEKNGNDGYETPQVPGQANKSSDGYETPQPPREGRRRSATYANQGVPADPIQEEVNYYNEA